MTVLSSNSEVVVILLARFAFSSLMSAHEFSFQEPLILWSLLFAVDVVL